MINVGIIGCGKIAEQHANKIAYMKECNLASVCDLEELMARQMSERFKIKHHFSDTQKFLAGSNLDVVHITTPPQSHYELARQCLLAGKHIYVEKPFTLNFNEANDLIQIAQENKLKLTVGHNLQFSHAAMRMRELINKGYLGGLPLHIESYYCYDLGDARYVNALLGDKSHWVRALPGKLLQNVISHGISKIAEFINGDNPEVIAYGFNSPMMRQIGAQEIIDELRVVIIDGQERTAYFTFSTQFKPYLRHLRVYGKENGIIVDDDNQTVIRVNGTAYKSYLNQFVPPLLFSRQYFSNFLFNVNKFAKSDFHADVGMKYLIKFFYDSITNDTPPPIPYREILTTSRIIDNILSQVYPEPMFDSDRLKRIGINPYYTTT